MGGSVSGSASSSAMPKLLAQRLAHRLDAEPAQRVLPARLLALAALAVLLLEQHDRARRIHDLPARHAPDVLAEQGAVLGLLCVMPEPAARPEVASASPCEYAGTSPMSLVRTSTELSVGWAIPILNLRGRYCSP